jgi:hypothetical protein
MNKNKITPVTTNEMRKFIGIVMYMSVIHLSGRRDYWSAATRQNFIAEAMSVNRFEQSFSMQMTMKLRLQKTSLGMTGYIKSDP